MHNTQRLLMVDPMKIEYTVSRGRRKDKQGDFGTVQGGNWDRRCSQFHRMDVWRAFKQHFVKGVPWQQTRFYRRVIDAIARGAIKWGCKTKAQFDTRCEELDQLYEQIRTEGFRQQSALEGKENSLDDVSVCIDRHGRLLFEDGRHRLCIAKLLKLKSIPVQVSLRHTKWFDFCQKVEQYSTHFRGRVYAPLPHPDLDNFPTIQGGERFKIISEALGDCSGTLLDIGAHWGYFSHRFEKLGMTCTAVEHETRHLYFLGQLRTAVGAKFDIYDGSIFDFKLNHFDVTLALNIFHHFLKQPETFEQLKHFLQQLDTKCLIFQPHLHNSRQMKGAYRNFKPLQFVDWVLKNTGLSQAKRLGAAKDGRPIYLLT
ncbi:MAG: 2-polyprenyl-3-methyl-5-hydroxy-6-metoxy-1,4-benzoquinol methylase [Phenylobacterium sp.]|jgi:2-polyprenyl-3-methyl-5-hydroxy-6-metoxy-1,4-benzoquinol methylase